MSTFQSLPTLRTLSSELRMLAGLAMLTLAVGYIHATAYVYLTTHMVPKGIEERFRGTEHPVDNVAASQSSAPAANSELQEAQDTLNASRPASSQTAESQPPGSATVTGELQYQKSLAEMLNLIHTHVITMTLIFALSGLITLMTGTLPRGFRKFIVIEPFFGILLTFLGIWCTRYVHPAFSWLANLSGAFMAFAFFTQCYAVVQELLISRKKY